MESGSEDRVGLARRLWREVTAFGVVGAVAFVVDNGGYNILVFGLPGNSPGILSHRAIVASALATSVATLVSWAGNRYWTYRHQRRQNMGHEIFLFIIVNMLGIALTALPVAASRLILDQHSLLSDNVARIIGWALATGFRFLCYRRLVFVGARGWK